MLMPTIVAAPRQQRVHRRPRHHFTLKHRPYQVQPFAIAPVLPGETLDGAVIQVRAKTDALASAVDLQGWWLEHYLFYTKLTDLADRDDFTEMLLTFGHDLSAIKTAADVATYHAASGVNWTKLCVDRIVEEYFRDEGDGTVTLDGLHQASVANDTWLDSAKLESATVTDDGDLPGQVSAEIPDELEATFSAYRAQWEHMRALKLTEASYDDWLRSHGVSAPTNQVDPDKDYRPELLRYSRDWQYPSTVVDGATSTSTSAVIWSISERADKKRFFREPGFIVGVTVARPKVYFSGQRGAAAILMDDAYAWLPAVLREEAYTSLKKATVATGGSGPLAGVPSEAYWVDLRDLLLHGDQFANFDVSSTPAGWVALPTSAMQKRFATSANIDAFFAVGTANKVRQDGVLSLDLKTTITETT